MRQEIRYLTRHRHIKVHYRDEELFIQLKIRLGRRFKHEKASLDDKLEKEKEELYRLANEALRNGIPLTQDEAFMAQNLKVDELVVKIIKGKNGLKKYSMNHKANNRMALH